jgi:hypothetical protein
MVQVELVAEDGTSCEVDLDPNYSLRSHIETAHDAIGLETRPPEDYALLATFANRYLTAEDWLEGVPDWLGEGRILEIVPLAEIEVNEALELLLAEDHAKPDDDDESAGASLLGRQMRLVFWMRKRLLLAQWAEEFIAQDGLSILLQVTAAGLAQQLAEGSALQAYGLQALRQALCWQSAMAQLCSSDEHAYLLFGLLYSDRPRVVSRALELVFVCCSAAGCVEGSELTFSTTLAAAHATAHVSRAPSMQPPRVTPAPASGSGPPRRCATSLRCWSWSATSSRMTWTSSSTP